MKEVMARKALLSIVLFLQLPQTSRTPGVANPAVTQANIQTTICVKNWTKTVRPKSSVTNRLKAAQMQAWALPGKPKAYEEDHFVPLELGGHPTDARNLWPEAYSPKPGAHEKDKVENYLHRQVCAGAVTLKEAQRLISTDWLTVYKSLSKK